jgi:hypothetical protein
VRIRPYPGKRGRHSLSHIPNQKWQYRSLNVIWPKAYASYTGPQVLHGAGVERDSLYASILLQEALRKYTSSQGCMIRGGDGEGDDSYFDKNGRFFGNYSGEFRDSEGADWIFDVTAEQFGVDPIKSVTEAAKYLRGMHATPSRAAPSIVHTDAWSAPPRIESHQ